MSDCIEWTGARMPKGYGIRDKDNGTRLVHRQAMEELLGRRLDPSETVMHICDNPPCYNTEHLRVGTIAENNADMAAKGRARNGSTNRVVCSKCGGPYTDYVSAKITKRRCEPCYQRTQQDALDRRRAATIAAGKTPRRSRARGEL